MSLPDFAPQACGSLATEIAGLQVTMRPSGGLWLEASGTLIVADLHLEKGSSYAMRGQMLPPYDTRDALGRLTREAAICEARTVILLGDTFHDRTSEARLTDADSASLRALARNHGLVWVIGNHDADGPRHLPGDVAEEMSLSALILRHEPQPGPQRGEVAGHLHPCARVKASRGSVRRRCFVTDGERIIVPAFGAYAGGLNVLDAAFAPLLGPQALCGVLGSDRVHAVGWKSLRPD
jgi:hypothetical protein